LSGHRFSEHVNVVLYIYRIHNTDVDHIQHNQLMKCYVTHTQPFIGFWQPRKAGLNEHTGKSCIHKIHKITSLETIQSK